MDVPVGPPIITVYAEDEILVSDPSGRLSSTEEQGYLAADTRLVSGYRLRLGGVAPVLLNSSEVEHYSSRFEFVNAEFPTMDANVPEGTVHLRLDRTIGGGVHEDYDLVNYGPLPLRLDVEVSIQSDFADIFDMKRKQLVRRGSIVSEWHQGETTLVTSYRSGTFERGLKVVVARPGSAPEFANGSLLFQVALWPGERWHTCIYWLPQFDDRATTAPERACHDLVGFSDRDKKRRDWAARSTRFTTSDPEIDAVVSRAVDDLASMRLHRHDEAAGADEDSWVPAAGVPWFVSLFGRDALVVALQTVALSPAIARGTLRALGALQADCYDDERDMQPGKILHEVRRGELAHLGLIPHRPYYGTHDATSLYVWTAAEAWRWHRDVEEMERIRPVVERCLSWIDTDGDADGDGLQEYRTRADAGGYVNQGWKDAFDAIVGGDGLVPDLPFALCELQAYVIAAKRAWAQVAEEAFGDASSATRLRREADTLASRLEERFWWEDEGTYYLGLDGEKRPIEAVTSNPGHLLWAGAVDPARAASVARRLLADDMWTGWGIRTLSSRHPRYNPFSYQLGSVWPHDNAIAAAGFRRYGCLQQTHDVAAGILDAARLFEARRLPELFAGLERGAGSFPVQYLGANVPQAWASGAAVHLLTTLLGIAPGLDAGEVVVDPALPEWLPALSVERLRVGEALIHLDARRIGDGHEVDVRVTAGDVRVRHAPS